MLLQQYVAMKLLAMSIIFSFTDETQDTDDSTVSNKSTVTHLKAADLDKYTIYDVMLPLPGFNIQLPHNEVCVVKIYEL